MQPTAQAAGEKSRKTSEPRRGERGRRYGSPVGVNITRVEVCGIPPFAKNAKDGAPGT